MSITVDQARRAAIAWVNDVAARWPRFDGAFMHGSITRLPDHEPFPATSTVNVVVVMHGEPRIKHGMYLFDGVLLDVSVRIPASMVAPEGILDEPLLAAIVCGAKIIADPTGFLTEVQQSVARDFAKREWVLKRCKLARFMIRMHLDWIDPEAPFHLNVGRWLSSCSLTTQLLLVARLRDPIVRSRYMAVRDVLVEYDRLEIHEELLDLLGSRNIRRERVESHMGTLTDAFDAAKLVVRSQDSASSMISDIARPVVIDGIRAEIAAGYHREAMARIAVNYSRCQEVLSTVAPLNLRDQFTFGYRSVLADLGITSLTDLQMRADRIRDCLPRLWDIAELIIANNPEIRDER
jgi:hypothetical protein